MRLWSIFDFAGKEKQLGELKKQSEADNLWDNRENALQLMKKVSELTDLLESWKTLQKKFADVSELAELGDDNLRPELEHLISTAENELAKSELTVLFTGNYDHGNALVTVSPGAGGTESQDWASMLMRMYLRWMENSGFHAEIIDFSEGEEAGIKSVTISVEGKYAYGYLRAEKGVHRLVRLSPFDAAHRRHTSFAMVEVLPADVGGEDGVEINPEDLKIDIYKSSGAGGQNVQKNATAIRITHLPTGIVVSCQNERSQLQNRENAMRVLRARLLEIKEAEDEKHLAELRGEYVKTEWGSQIRSYVLHPYQMVKDHRTNYEVGNAQSVLDGGLDGFIEAYLRSRKPAD